MAHMGSGTRCSAWGQGYKGFGCLGGLQETQKQKGDEKVFLNSITR